MSFCCYSFILKHYYLHLDYGHCLLTHSPSSSPEALQYIFPETVGEGFSDSALLAFGAQ